MAFKYHNFLILVLIGAAPVFAFSQRTVITPAGDRAWISRSNEFTKILIGIDEKFNPEFGSEQGFAQYDTMVSSPTLANLKAKRNAKEEAVAYYKSSKLKETDHFVRQDLDILIWSSEHDFRVEDFELEKEIAFLNPTTMIFDGIKILLDDQTPLSRRPAALIRLRKYAGMQAGYESLTKILMARTISQMARPDMIYPAKQKITAALSYNSNMVDGIRDLFIKYNINGWEEPYAEIKKQLDDYDQWIADNLLPKARTDFRLPPEKYKLALEGYGIDILPAEIAGMAHAMFSSLQQQMKPMAEQVAKKYNLPSADYRNVIQFLKKKQIIGDSIMLLYTGRLSQIEEIIRKEKLVTLPNRPAIIRLASAAETAKQPAPHMDPPPFLNNTGQRGVFVLPLNMAAAAGAQEDRYDDFTFDAASWTIIAHEVRPGHELQFDKMVEEGISTARALYAINSTNVEGWGLYSESIVLPYMPLEGQLISLDYRLLRAARAFLDPELQAGTISQEQALDILMKDVVSSHAFAKQEVERYTLRAPGQANSYFYGFVKMVGLRKDAETALGAQFSPLRFHDFILSQGVLPPALIREAVMSEFVPKEKK